MDATNIDGLASAIARECQSYRQAAEKATETTIKGVAKEAAEKVKQGSPRDTGRYRKGWRVKVSNANGASFAVIYNATDAPLTHLLEYGHALPQGGRAKAYPHIKSVEEWVNDEAVRRLEDELDEID